MMSRAPDKHADVTDPMTKYRYILRFWALAIILFSVIMLNVSTLSAQEPPQWSPQQRIPDFHPATDSPILVTDQNRTVHAFSSQWLGQDEDDAVRAIMYNQWTLEGGWTLPIDILLPPIKTEARIKGAFLDQSGIIHVAFFAGDEDEANIYYSRAPAVDAARAPAWSKPALVGEAAATPDVAALAGDDKGNLVILYGGEQQGWGLYAAYSADGGDTWTDPVPTFLTYEELFPFALIMSPGQSGSIHVVWDVRDLGGNGRQINYAGLNLDDRQWSEPITLAKAETGYGVLFPTVVEYGDEVVVAYSGVTIQRSRDGGRTWTEPVKPFRHVGVNGIMSFVVDSKDDLHLLWAQRITGSPDIHGTWDSIWQDGRWSEPEAIVSGPQVPDQLGDKAFDPFDVRAIVSQGNVLLATWRSDPGLKGNGVWYSYKRLDAPEMAVVPLPTVAPTPTPHPDPTATPSSPTPTPKPRPIFMQPTSVDAAGSFLNNNPANSLVVGLVPVVLLMAVVFMRALIRQSRS